MWGQDDQDAARAAGNHVRVWVFTTDQGPHQVAASRVRQSDVENSVIGIVTAQRCLAHVFHLMVKFQVQQLYSGKFRGSLTKVVNLWRSCGDPKKIREGLQQEHPSGEVAAAAGDRSGEGGGGREANSENYLWAFTKDELLYVWEEKLVVPWVCWGMIPCCAVFTQATLYTWRWPSGQAQILHIKPAWLVHLPMICCSLVRSSARSSETSSRTSFAVDVRSGAESVPALQDFVRISDDAPIRSVSPVPPASTTSDHPPSHPSRQQTASPCQSE